MKIIDLDRNNFNLILQAAKLLIDCFDCAWSTMIEAIEEVIEALEEGNISRAAVDEQGDLLGWIAGSAQYDGNVWELHPLVVRRDSQNRGIGRMLVEDFEKRACERGGITVILGTDDESYSTSIGGIDVYLNLYDNMKNIKNLRKHSYEFYEKVGYKIVGIIPDANGFGKPDILMAKRIKME